MAEVSTDRRREPRLRVALPCTLRRRIGAPISCSTVDLGMGGMSVSSGRPLATDERLAFQLSDDVSGFATVLRQKAHGVYALRFEHLQDAARAALAQITGRA